ncbi:MAG: Protein GrpE [Parcubacteria group bacterium GW2011_GWA1_47_8]|nr:MAG: Protein GrpE [Parcubacteria group bacterium GW2011_GWA1_47_8]
MKKEQEYEEKGVKEEDRSLGDTQNLDTKEGDMYSDDVQFENEDENVNAAAVQKKLHEKLRACEAEKKEYLDGWQRMRADFANARKEEDIRRGELVKFASEGLVEDVLPVLDSFTMAFGNKEAWGKVDENWRKGVEYIYAQLFSVLEARGLSEIGAVGERLDPRLHIAMETVETNDGNKADTVSEVIQKGYRLHSKVIRPAKVKSFGYNGE